MLAGRVVSGDGVVGEPFIAKVRGKIDSAMQQLVGYRHKVVFLHITLDLGLPTGNAELTIRDVAPTGVKVVVFLNYDWAKPKWEIPPRTGRTAQAPAL